MCPNFFKFFVPSTLLIVAQRNPVSSSSVNRKRVLTFVIRFARELTDTTNVSTCDVSLEKEFSGLYRKTVNGFTKKG